jgi:uncharacterized RDD family membrane protein YckC
MIYGGFWLRLVAYVIDQIIVSVCAFVVSFIFGFAAGTVLRIGGQSGETIIAVGQIIGFIIGLLINWLYYAVLESSARQATFGKQALGLIVTDTDGYRISFGRASGRYFAKILSGLILGIGFLMIGFTQRKQGLHDQIANTLVTRSEAGLEQVADTFA